MTAGAARPAAGLGDAPRRASALAAVVLCLLMAGRLADVASSGHLARVPFTAALFVLPLLCAFSRTRALLARYRWPVLAAQATLTWVAFAVFGGGWQVGIGGLLAGLVLLLVPGRVSWPVAGGLLAADIVARAAVTGLPAAQAWIGVLYTVVYDVDDALLLFGMVRLTQIVGEIEHARRRSADLAVAGERLQAARGLQAAVGRRLAGIAAQAAAARQALAHHPARARDQISAVGVSAREAAAQARAMTAGEPALPGREPAAPPPARAAISARLAWVVLVSLLLRVTLYTVGVDASLRYGARLTALAIGAAVLIAAVQLYHSWAARTGRRPPAWPATLALQAVLVYSFALPFIWAEVNALAAFLAGSILLLVPGRRRWAGYAAVVGSWPLLATLLPLRGNTLPVTLGQHVATALILASVIAEVGLAVYGLAWLAALARQLEGLQGELVRVAMVGERLRIARDVHDLLGLGLSAIALKADLIGRLIGRDDARADAELAELGRICSSARADIRQVTGNEQRLSLAAELTAAEQILTSAGIQAQADVGPLPAEADEVLATVLREAITNVLRHSSATACTIEAGSDQGTLRFHVSNDGAAEPTVPDYRRGSGLRNLSARVQAVGGRLTTRQAEGRFDLIAEIPLVTAAR